jgi:hypothetical protein
MDFTHPREGYWPMMPAETSYVFWLLIAVELLGLASAVVARVSEGSRRENWCQRIFLAVMGVVGIVAIISLGFGPDCWLAAGGTFSLMVLIATTDFGHSARTTTW